MKNIFLVFGVVASISYTALSAMEIPKKESVDQEVAKEVDLKQRAKVAIGQFLISPELVEKVLSFVSHGMQKTQAKDWARCAVVNKEFNTLAHAWLPGNLQESGEYTLFKQVMKLRTIAAEAAQKSLTAEALVHAKQYALYIASEPNPYREQTSKGIFLSVGSQHERTPVSLATPWGRIFLYKTGAQFKTWMIHFLQQVSVTFYDAPVERYHYITPIAEWLCPDHVECQSLYRVNVVSGTNQVHWATIHRGRQVIVYVPWGHCADYAIHAIDGEKVETLVEKEVQSHYRSKGCALMLWRTLEMMYQIDKDILLARAPRAIEPPAENNNG